MTANMLIRIVQASTKIIFDNKGCHTRYESPKMLIINYQRISFTTRGWEGQAEVIIYWWGNSCKEDVINIQKIEKHVSK